MALRAAKSNFGTRTDRSAGPSWHDALDRDKSRSMQTTVRKIHAREILDSRGFPTVEAEVTLDTVTERAAVPSGASTGEGEAIELRDGDQRRFMGKGTLKAVANARDQIGARVTGKTFESQADFDRALCVLDATPNKAKLGANAILAVSMAYARAVARLRGEPLYQSLASQFHPEKAERGSTLPVPLMNILNGGKHADNGLAIQEFMIVPAGFTRFSDALRAGTEVFHQLKKILHTRGLSTAVGDEGGFAPVFTDKEPHEQAIQVIMQAIAETGYRAGKDIFLALDCAASEFIKDGRYQFEGQSLTSPEMVAVFQKWKAKYPVVSIEDGMGEADWEGWTALTRAMSDRCQLVGDDLFVTNTSYLQKGIEQKVANAILIKLNQIGTVTETLETMRLAAKNGYASISSHRSGETEDPFIADLAVGTDCGQIKTGSASRTDRIAKYNQLIRIEEELGSRAKFSGVTLFSRYF